MSNAREVRNREKHRMHRKAKRKELKMHGFRKKVEAERAYHARTGGKKAKPRKGPGAIMKAWMQIMEKRFKHESKEGNAGTEGPASNAIPEQHQEV